ncbi:MAG: succinate dehydrogenase cytochrome b subunit [Planctomycetota bacterium]
MSWVLDYWRSSIGGKVTMAVTGGLLFVFVLAHLAGNLLLFGGPQAIAEYAAFLHGKPAMLWVGRLGLLAALALHVATGLRLARANRAARPVPYAIDDTVQATFASRSMVFTGLTILVYLVYHLLHFTLGAVHGADFALRGQGHGGHDVYAMVTASFGHPAIAIVYAAAQIVLFLHLRHGIQSLAQTLGFHHGRWTPLIRTLGTVVAGAIAGGNALLALSVQLGLVGAAS